MSLRSTGFSAPKQESSAEMGGGHVCYTAQRLARRGRLLGWLFIWPTCTPLALLARQGRARFEVSQALGSGPVTRSVLHGDSVVIAARAKTSATAGAQTRWSSMGRSLRPERSPHMADRPFQCNAHAGVTVSTGGDDRQEEKAQVLQDTHCPLLVAAA